MSYKKYLRRRDLESFGRYARKLANGEAVRALKTDYERFDSGAYSPPTKLVRATEKDRVLWKQIADEIDEFLNKRP